MIVNDIIEQNILKINNSHITKIGDYVFAYCSNLTSVNLPAARNIGDHAFYSCSSLKSAKLPAATTVGVGAFNNCFNLVSVNLSAVISIEEYAFSCCYSLISINLPEITNIGYHAFRSCSSLTTVNVPAVANIEDGAFVGCFNLSSIDLPAALSIGTYAFGGCSKLTSANLPAATNIGDGAFDGCSNLASVSLPAATNIGDEAFARCSNLASVSLPAVTSIGYNAFSGCSKLINIYINSNSLCIGSSDMFLSTPIDKTYSINGKYGKIRVYAPLVEQYKIASYWSIYADRIFPIGTLIVFTGATENNIYYQYGIKTLEVYGYGQTQFDIYNKTWGKLSVTIDNVKLSDTPLEYNIVAPTDYKTITVKNTSDQSFDSYTISYDDISFICTSFPDTIGVSSNTKISINASNSSYQVKIIDLEIISNTIIDFTNYLEEVTYTNVSITADNAAQYTTLVDGSNFEVSSEKIQSGSNSYNVDSGFSLGHIEIDTPDFESNLSITYSISSESEWDYGIVLLSTTEQSLTSNIRDSIPLDCTELIRVSGIVSSATYTTTLAANTHYYVYFAYAKDSSSNSDNDRFYIENISYTNIK